MFSRCVTSSTNWWFFIVSNFLLFMWVSRSCHSFWSTFLVTFIWPFKRSLLFHTFEMTVIIHITRHYGSITIFKLWFFRAEDNSHSTWLDFGGRKKVVRNFWGEQNVFQFICDFYSRCHIDSPFSGSQRTSTFLRHNRF